MIPLQRYRLTHETESFLSWAGVCLTLVMSSALLVRKIPVAWQPLSIGAAGLLSLLGFFFYHLNRGKVGSTISGAVSAAVWLALFFLVRFALWHYDAAWGSACFFALALSALIYLMGEERYPEQREEHFLLLPTGSAVAGGAVGSAAAALLARALSPQDALFAGVVCVVVAALLAVSAPERASRRFGPLRSAVVRGGRMLLLRHRVVALLLLGSLLAFGLLAASLAFSLHAFTKTSLSLELLAITFSVLLLCALVLTALLQQVIRTSIRRSRASFAYLLSPLLFFLGFLVWAIVPDSTASASVLILVGPLALLGCAVPSWRLALMSLPVRLRRLSEVMIFGVGGGSGVAVFSALLFALQRLTPVSLYVSACVVALCYLVVAWFARLASRREWVRMVRRGEWVSRHESEPPERLANAPTEEVMAHVASEDPLSQQVGLCLAAGASKPARYLSAVEKQLARPLIAPVRSWARRYLAALPRSHQWALLESDSGNVRASVVSAAIWAGFELPKAAKKLLEDPSPRVRGLAAIYGMQRGIEGAQVIWEHLPRERLDDDLFIECLEVLEGSVSDPLALCVKKLAWHPSPAVRLSALHALNRLLEDKDFAQADLLEVALSGIAHEDAKLRSASAPLLARIPTHNGALHLARLLEDDDDCVRESAADSLALLGEAGVQAAEGYLASHEMRSRHAALFLIAKSGRAGEKLLHRALEGLEALSRLCQVVTILPSTASQLLLVALEDFRCASIKSVGIVVKARGLLEAKLLIDQLLEEGRDEEWDSHVDAITHVAPRHLVRPLSAMRPLQISLSPASEDPGLRPKLEALVASGQRMLQIGAIVLMDELFGEQPLVDSSDPKVLEAIEILQRKGSKAERELPMHRTLFLKKVPFFSGLFLDELLEIESNLEEEEYLAGEVIFREGDVGDCFYIVFEGRVRIVSGTGFEGRELLMAGPGVHFGEMALFGGAPRSASAIAKSDCVLLSLEKSRFRSLMINRPQILLRICSELSKRLRAMTPRSAGSPGNH